MRYAEVFSSPHPLRVRARRTRNTMDIIGRRRAVSILMLMGIGADTVGGWQLGSTDGADAPNLGLQLDFRRSPRDRPAETAPRQRPR